MIIQLSKNSDNRNMWHTVEAYTINGANNEALTVNIQTICGKNDKANPFLLQLIDWE